MSNTAVTIRGGLTPQNNECLDLLIVDASASMDKRWWNTFTALEVYAGEARKTASHLGCYMFLTYRGGFVFHPLVEIQPADKVPPLEKVAETAGPAGDTPLLDAIVEAGRLLKDRAPARATIIFATDGEENSSRTTVEFASSILTWMRSLGYQVIFLGIDFENSHLARRLGLSTQNCLGARGNRLSEAMRLLSTKAAAYRQSGAEISISDDDRRSVGGLLPPPQ